MTNSKKIETVELDFEYQGVRLKGTCRIIPFHTYYITMEKPYPGLTTASFLPNGFTMENIMGRLDWDMRSLYEEYQSILYDYDRYRKVFDEWQQFEQHLREMTSEIEELKAEADDETAKVIDFHLSMIDRYAHWSFEELLSRHDIMAHSLSPSVLATSLKHIESKYLNKTENDESEIKEKRG